MGIQVKRYSRENEILEPTIAKPGKDWIVIVPTQKKVSLLKESLGIFQEAIEIMTLPTFMQNSYKRMGGKSKIISSLQQEFALEKICLELADKLQHFNNMHKYPGTASKLRGFFSALAQYRLSLAECKISESLKGDLNLINNEYKAFLQRKDIIDLDFLSKAVLDVLGKEPCQEQNIILDTLLYHTPLDRAILGALLDNAAEAHVYMDLPVLELKEVNNFSELMGLFRGTDFGEKIMELRQEKIYHTFFNCEDEVKAVAGKIRSLVVGGVEPKDILIIPSNLASYRPLISELFPQYGLIGDFSKGIPLSATPLSHLVGVLLRLVTNPYSRHLLLQFFSCQLVDYEGLNFEIIDRVARQLNYNDLELMLKNMSSFSANGEWLQQGQLLNKFIKEELLPLKEEKEPEQTVLMIMTLLKKVKLVERILEIPSGIKANRVKEDLIVLNKINEVFREISEIHKYLSEDQEKMPFVDFRRYFSELLKDKEYYLPETKGGIPITNLLNLRGWQGKYLFFLGVNEDDYPQKTGFNFLLPNLYDCQEQMWECELQIYSMLTSTDEMFVSRPALKGNKQTTPSPLLSFFNEEEWSVTDKYLAEDEILLMLSENPLESLWKREATKEDLEILKMQTAKFTGSPRGIYDGIVGDLGFNLQDPVFSVSQVEDFMRCPFMYYLKRIVGLRPREEVEEELENTDFGVHIHSILEHFGQRGGFAKLISNPTEAALFLKGICLEVLEEYGVKFEDNLFLQGQYENWWRGLAGEGGPPGVFTYFLKEEADKMQHFEPLAFEYVFGPNNEETLNIGPWQLKGRIDRIDLWKGTKQIVIYDYKTGSFPSKKDIEEKKSLQLPMYLLALKSSQHFQDNMMSGIYYGLNHRSKISYSTIIGEMLKDIWPRKQSVDLESLGGQEEYEIFIENLYRALLTGEFPVTALHPGEAGCNYCDYRLICRYNYRRHKGD